MATLEPVTGTTKTGEHITIRCAEASDAAQLVALMSEIIAEGAYTLAEPDEWTTTPEQERESIAEHAEQPGYLYLVAAVDGAVVGKLEFENGRRRRTAHSGMFSVYVRSEWRERGIGRLLMEHLIGWATDHAMIEKVTLAVFSNNHRAITAYQKCGFREEGRCPRDMKIASGQYLDSVLMYRFVKPDDHGTRSRLPMAAHE